LSEKAGIDEINALRITVLEWQTRPASRLIGRLADEEATSLKRAAGVDTFRVSLAGPSFADIFNARPGDGNSAAEFVSEKNRRLRLREIYLSERSHIVKTARKLLALSLDSDGQDNAPRQQPGSPNNLHKLGASIFETKITGNNRHEFARECIKGVEKRLSAIDGEGGWLGVAESSEDIESLWRTTLVEEVSHLLQSLFMLLQTSSEIPPADLLLSWLRLMVDNVFLESLQAVCFSHVSSLQRLANFR
jgi:nuclear pore complex protein Nup188